MTHRRPAALAAVATTLTLLLAACGGGPAASPLSDPTEILQAAARQASTAKSVHVDITADGQLGLDLMGTGAGQALPLSGTTASIDADLADQDLQMTFALPGLLGLRGDVIVVDDTAYAKTSLTGALYQSMPLDSAGVPSTGASPDPGQPIRPSGARSARPAVSMPEPAPSAAGPKNVPRAATTKPLRRDCRRAATLGLPTGS